MSEKQYQFLWRAGVTDSDDPEIIKVFETKEEAEAYVEELKERHGPDKEYFTRELSLEVKEE